MACAATLVSSVAVTTITAGFGSRVWMRFMTSRPLSPGIWRSRRITSGRRARMSFSAFLPSGAVSTSYVASKCSLRTSTTSISSSPTSNRRRGVSLRGIGGHHNAVVARSRPEPSRADGRSVSARPQPLGRPCEIAAAMGAYARLGPDVLGAEWARDADVVVVLIDARSQPEEEEKHRQRRHDQRQESIGAAAIEAVGVQPRGDRAEHPGGDDQKQDDQDDAQDDDLVRAEPADEVAHRRRHARKVLVDYRAAVI